MIAACLGRLVSIVALTLCGASIAFAQSPAVDAAPTPTVADELAVRLAYTRVEGAESCPDEAALRDAVHLHLGYAVFDRQPATRELLVSVRRVRSRFLARIEIRSVDGAAMGARELDSRSSTCDELAAALGLAIAVALDPTPLTRSPQPTRPDPPVVTEPAACPVASPCPQCPTVAPAPPPPSAPAEPASDVSWSLSAGGALGLGALPSLAPAASLTGVLEIGALGLLLEGVVYPEATTTISSTQLGTQTQLARAGVCGLAAGSGQLRLSLCGLVAVGALRGASPGALDRSATPISAIGARLSGQARLLGPLWLELRADAYANLIRTTVSLQGQELWTSPAMFIELGLSGVVRFL